MSWLRIDDGFAQHPKVIQLVAKDRWTWMEVLCYCARYRTDGNVPDAIGAVVRGSTGPFLERCYQLGLLDLSELGNGSYVVHDWDDFNPKDPTAAARQERKRQRDSDRDKTVTAGVTSRDSRVDARARPVPSPVSSNGAVGVGEQHRVRNLVDVSLAEAS